MVGAVVTRVIALLREEVIRILVWLQTGLCLECPHGREETPSQARFA
jgi:hypothetical protein